MHGFGVDAMGYNEDPIKTDLARERRQRIANSIDDLYSFGPVDVFVMNSVLEHIPDVGLVFNLVS